MLRTADSLLALVGNTPLVELSRFAPGPVRVFAKLEAQNPTGSIKDRVAKAMIETAEASGELEPGRRLLEPTSGNTGISLALVAKLKGYPLTCVMPENATEERKRLLRLYGATLILTPGEEGSNGAVRRAQQLADEHPEWCFIYQYGNDANPRAHYEGTGPEIWRDVPELTHFVAGLGTAGTLMGVGRFLKERSPAVQVIAAEPEDAFHGLEGLKHMATSIVPGIYHEAELDQKLGIATDDAYAMVYRLGREEGLIVGQSCGAAYLAALMVARPLTQGTIVVVFPDFGERYLSTNLWLGWQKLP